MRAAMLLAVIVLPAGVLWLAGEQHRENCERAGKVGCSVLPWDNGQQPQAVDVGDMPPAQRLIYCATLRDAGEPVPPEC